MRIESLLENGSLIERINENITGEVKLLEKWRKSYKFERDN